MNDDKDMRQVKTASLNNPLDLPFKFTVPRKLLSTSCSCVVSNAQHLHLPPSVGSWDRCDDMSADMCVPSITLLIARSKIGYQVVVKVLSMVNGKSTNAAEAVEPVQILPIY